MAEPSAFLPLSDEPSMAAVNLVYAEATSVG
jgi:hypothetical protein